MFWPKSSVNPFEKNQYDVYEKSYFYSLGGLVFFLKDPQNTISRPILSKNKLS